jgi:hypothetical protein
MARVIVIPLLDERFAHDPLCLGLWQEVTQGLRQGGLRRTFGDGWLIGPIVAASGKQHSGHRQCKQTMEMHLYLLELVVLVHLMG